MRICACYESILFMALFRLEGLSLWESESEVMKGSHKPSRSYTLA